MLERRRALPGAERERASTLVARWIAASQVFAASRRVVLYAPTGAELSTRGIQQAALASGKELLWPRVGPSAELEIAAAHPSQLTPDALGVPAPPPGHAALSLSRDALVIVPGLAFTRRGLRLGRGGGHYDRLLVRWPEAASIGVAFDIQLVDELPSDAHDRRVQFVATPSGMWRTVA